MDAIALIRRLADGAWRESGNPEGWAAALAPYGLELERAGGRCRLVPPFELLDAGVIRAGLDEDRVTVEVVDEIDSTNTALIARLPPPAGHATVLLAEFQRSGRGRAGRSWLSPYGGGLCLSLGWRFDPAPVNPGTLSLAVGIAVRGALVRSGVDDVMLKWPNDILLGGRKLGGILVDAANAGGALHVVAGIGINVRLATQDADRIAASGGLPPVDLAGAGGRPAGRRNALATAVIGCLVDVFSDFQEKGFEPLRQEWNDADGLRGQAVSVGDIDGRAAGIDDSGALLIQADKTVHRVVAGDVRIRVS